MHLDHIELIFLVFAVVLTFGAIGVLYLVIPRTPPELFAAGQTIKIDEWDIHYTIQGQGPPLLLIHGLGASLHSWSAVANLLSRDFRVIALDLPGFGRSSKHSGAEYGLDSQTTRIEKFLDAIKVDKCFLVGNSMGGNLALWLSKLHPDRFPSIVVIAPAAHPKLVPWGARHLALLSGPASWMFNKQMATWLHRRTLGMPEKLDSRHVSQTMSVYSRNPAAVKTFIAATAAIRDNRMLDHTFESRVLILYGERDTVVPRWTIDKLLPRVSNAQLEIHSSGGHQLQEDDPEWVCEKTKSFFRSGLDVGH